MCGIFGIGFVKNNELKRKDLIIRLVKELGKRTEGWGRASSGIAMANQFRIDFVKQKMPMSELLELHEVEDVFNKFLEPNKYIPDTNTYAIIGHCRVPTKGSPNINENNHPINVGDILGVHTGHIANDDDLFIKYKDDLKRIAQVDSEIIFQLINKYRKEENNFDFNREESAMVTAIKKSFVELKGSLACALLSKEDKYKIYLFKKYSPIDVNFYTNLGIVVFSSGYSGITKPAMGEVFAGDELENIEIKMDVDSGLAINLAKSSFYKFDFTKKETENIQKTDKILYSGADI